MSVVIKVENVSKLYRLGEIGTGSLSHDINRWWHKIRGKEDPYLKIGQANDRSTKGESDYVYALKNVSFEVQQGEVLGIIGRNGAGKSTLLKILSRVTTPSTGEIKAKGRIASLLEVGTGFHPELSGRDNIFLNGSILGMRKNEIARKFDEIVEFSGCERYIDTPVKRYSSGMYVRLAFAVAAHLESEILIVDEVLAVGDAEFQKKCIGKIKDVAVNGKTILFVSHNMSSISKLCGSGIYLKMGEISTIGTIKSAIEAYSNSKSTSNQAEVDLQLNDVARQGTGKAKFSHFSIRDSAGRLCSLLPATEPFEVEFEIKLLSDQHSLKYGISIVSDDGTELFGTSAHDSGMPTSLSKGSHRFKCRLSNNFLLPGKYTVRAAIFNNTEIFDHIDEVVSYEIIDLGFNPENMPSNHKVGHLYIPFLWNKINL